MRIGPMDMSQTPITRAIDRTKNALARSGDEKLQQVNAPAVQNAREPLRRPPEQEPKVRVPESPQTRAAQESLAIEQAGSDITKAPQPTQPTRGTINLTA
ncbi:MAG: hypothetical protein PHC61_05695 [Chitinivibrionales bacterium]|nr:hypothetical protein [Chitinivibrionales bacterium]